MHSNELIELLSDDGKKDLSSSLQWINPIPKDATALIEKIEMALKIVNFSQSRRAEESDDISNNHLDALIRLKAEVKSIFDKS